MRKAIFYLLMGLTACIMPISSQNSISINPQAGLNLANITSTNGSFRPGLKFGASGEYLFAPEYRWGVELGLYYSMQGSLFKKKNLSPEHDYLLVPLLAKFYLNNGGLEGQGLNFFAGPQFDLLAVTNKIAFLREIEGDLLPDPMTKVFGFSAVAGAGYVFKNGFTVSANLNLGLTNKAKDNLWYSEEFLSRGHTSYKDVVIQVNFGYRFTLGQKWFTTYNVPAILDPPKEDKPLVGSLGIEIEP